MMIGGKICTFHQCVRKLKFIHVNSKSHFLYIFVMRVTVSVDRFFFKLSQVLHIFERYLELYTSTIHLA